MVRILSIVRLQCCMPACTCSSQAVQRGGKDLLCAPAAAPFKLGALSLCNFFYSFPSLTALPLATCSPVATHLHTTCSPHTPIHTCRRAAERRNPQQADVFLSASGDCSLKVWDVRQPGSSLTLRAHDAEVLCADWCKYNDCLVATGSVDKSIKVWDVRMPEREVAALYGHT